MFDEAVKLVFPTMPVVVVLLLFGIKRGVEFIVVFSLLMITSRLRKFALFDDPPRKIKDVVPVGLVLPKTSALPKRLGRLSRLIISITASPLKSN